MNIREEYKDLVNQLNEKLANEYGYFTDDIPNWRIAWSDDQFEIRNVTSDAPVVKFDEHGNKIGEQTGIMLLPKYRQWMPHMWVLERCCATDLELGGNKELTTPYSYEPAFAFRDKYNKELPPSWDICWLVIFRINTELKLPVKVYKDPDLEPGAYKMKIEHLMSELFANESNVGDALYTKNAIIVPRNYKELN